MRYNFLKIKAFWVIYSYLKFIKNTNNDYIYVVVVNYYNLQLNFTKKCLTELRSESFFV